MLLKAAMANPIQQGLKRNQFGYTRVNACGAAMANPIQQGLKPVALFSTSPSTSGRNG